MLIGYVAQHTVLTSRNSASTLEHIPASMEEAAQIAAAGWATRMRRIVVLMSRKAILAAWLIARDTGLRMLVYPSGPDTLPVRTLTVMANGRPSVIAALCVLMIGKTPVPARLLAVPLRSAERNTWR